MLSDDPNATVEDVADEAGLARSTVYRRFGSRDELIAAVRRRAMEENQALFRETVAREPDFARCMDELIHASVHLAHRRRRLWQRLSEIGAELRLEDFDTRDEFVGWLEGGRRERVLRDDLPLGWIVSMWMHLVMAGSDATDGYGVDIDEAARMAVEAAARALRAPSP